MHMIDQIHTTATRNGITIVHSVYDKINDSIAIIVQGGIDQAYLLYMRLNDTSKMTVDYTSKSGHD